MNLRDLINRVIGTPKSRWDEKTAKYGWAEVSAESARLIFEEIVAEDLSKLGFTIIKPFLLGRPVDKDIIQLIKLKRVKGISYILMWGVSLSFVPHRWDSKVEWHRTLKSAHFDLFEQGLSAEREADSRIRPTDPEPYVDWLRGNACFNDDLVRVWGALRPHIMQWWDTGRTLEDLLGIARRQEELHWRSFRHFPPQELVIACILARHGRLEESEEYFEQSADGLSRLPGDFDKLRSAVLSIQPVGKRE